MAAGDEADGVDEDQEEEDKKLRDRDSIKYGLVRDKEKGGDTYRIGKVLGSGMIGVACLS